MYCWCLCNLAFCNVLSLWRTHNYFCSQTFYFTVELPPKKSLRVDGKSSGGELDKPDTSIDLSRQLSLKLSGPLSPAALKSVRGSLHNQTDDQKHRNTDLYQDRNISRQFNF